jgi:hypothetical protein
MRWRGPAEIVNDRPKDYDRRCSIEKKKILNVSLKGLGPNTNGLTVNRQS